MSEKKFQNYDEAFAFLLEFVDYEKVTKYKYDIAAFNLDRVEQLMAAAGSPQHSFRSVHVAGTKGKGSTAAMLQAILSAAGLRTGLFTSPHLVRLEERMTVDGAMMQESELLEIINELAPYTRRMRAASPNESPTFFELVTTAAFRHFARRKADFAVVEVGMGGRLDATNVIRPEVSVITRIDFDHVERLGETLGKIAFEKAGIIKPEIPVVCAPQDPEALAKLAQIAADRAAPLTLIGRDYMLEAVTTGVTAEGSACRFNLSGPQRHYEGLTLPLLGRHQAVNAAAAVAAAELLEQRCKLELGEQIIRRGLASARCPARAEFFPGSPPVLLDGAHNPVSMRSLCRTLEDVFAGRRIVLLLGFSRDKDIGEMLKLILPRADQVIFTRSRSPRAEDPALLAQMARELSNVAVETLDDPHQALSRARDLARLPAGKAGTDALICISGSFYLAGELRNPLVEEQRRTHTE